MLSEYSQLGPGQNALGTMGFEGGGLNGQSYGLDEVGSLTQGLYHQIDLLVLFSSPRKTRRSVLGVCR